ncbi:hypothetical protein LEMLEM_LOCUS3086 [Lemmus lemmus]
MVTEAPAPDLSVGHWGSQGTRISGEGCYSPRRETPNKTTTEPTLQCKNKGFFIRNRTRTLSNTPGQQDLSSAPSHQMSQDGNLFTRGRWFCSFTVKRMLSGGRGPSVPGHSRTGWEFFLLAPCEVELCLYPLRFGDL